MWSGGPVLEGLCPAGFSDKPAPSYCELHESGVIQPGAAGGVQMEHKQDPASPRLGLNVLECFLCTRWDFWVVEAGVTDSNRCRSPAPLWDRSGLGGACIAESLPTGSAVVLGGVRLKLLAAFMTLLPQNGKRKSIQSLCPQAAGLLNTAASYQDEGVWFPVGWSNLVREPGGDRFGGRDTKFRDGLRDEFDSIQQPLSSIVVVLQKTVRLQKKED